MGRIGTCPLKWEHPNARFVAFCHRRGEEVEKARRLHGVAGYTDLREMLAREKLDVLIIKTPTPVHTEQILATLGAGVHVFVDKPLCANAAELRAIEEAVARSGRVLQVNFELRNSGLPRRIRDVMAAEGGEPVHFYWHVMDLGWTTRKSPPKAWKLDAANTGGFINEKLCHYLDLAAWWLGSPLVRISACGAPVITSGYRGIWDNISLHAWTARGQTAWISWSTTAPKWKVSYGGIVGKRGAVFWDWKLEGQLVNRLQVTRHDTDAEGKMHETVPVRVEDYREGDQVALTHDNEGCFAAFVNRLLGRPDDTPYVTAPEAFHLTRLCLAAEESARRRGEPFDPCEWHEKALRGSG
jgi:predicted dehydrogenase